MTGSQISSGLVSHEGHSMACWPLAWGQMAPFLHWTLNAPSIVPGTIYESKVGVSYFFLMQKFREINFFLMYFILNWFDENNFVFFPHWGVEITVNCQSRLFDKNFAKTIFSKAMELYIWRNGKISVIIMFRFVFLLHNSLESRGDYAMQKIFENLKYYENLNSFT